jgi:two-component system sensor kinase FixL
MPRPLQLLVIDDSEDDAQLIVRELQHGGYAVTSERVATATALAAALQRHPWDVVVCEWNVPQCGRKTALAILEAHHVDVPFIVVSDQVDDARGVTAMRRGAADFVSKRQLARLCPAIERELRSNALRRTAKHVERELWLGNEIATQLSEGVVLVNVGDQRIAFTNPRFDAMFGYAPGELIGRHVSVINAPAEKSPEETAREITGALTNDKRWHGEVCNRRKDGSHFWCHASVAGFEHPDFGPVWVSVLQDITERKQLQEQILRTKSFLDSIVENIPNMVFVKDAKSLAFVLFNRAGEELLGQRRADLIGKNDYDFFPRGQADFFTEKDRAVLREKTLLDILEERIDTPRGQRILHTKKIPLLDENGKPRYLLGISEDITERKRAEEALQQSEARYRSLVTATTQVVWTTNAAGEVVDACPSWSAYTGQTAQEMMGRGWMAALHPGDRASAEATWSNAVKQRGLYATEFRARRRDGEYRDLSVRGVAVLAHDGTVHEWVGVCTDVTDLKRAREQLLSHQAQLAHVLRVHTMGEVAAEIAHELNQPICAISNYAQGCHRLILSGTPPDQLLSAIEEITAQALRAGEIIRGLRRLVQKQVTAHEGTDLNAVVTNAVQVLAAQGRQQGIAIRVHLTAEQLCIPIDPIQIEQVIINLMLNAFEAMRDGSDGEPELVVQTECLDHRTIVVRVRDRGTGLTPAIRERMFEPFYTTKPAGLGMGLSISRSIVERHRGRLWATDNTDGGATFHLALPRS